MVNKQPHLCGESFNLYKVYSLSKEQTIISCRSNGFRIPEENISLGALFILNKNEIIPSFLCSLTLEFLGLSPYHVPLEKARKKQNIINIIFTGKKKEVLKCEVIYTQKHIQVKTIFCYLNFWTDNSKIATILHYPQLSKRLLNVIRQQFIDWTQGRHSMMKTKFNRKISVDGFTTNRLDDLERLYGNYLLICVINYMISEVHF